MEDGFGDDYRFAQTLFHDFNDFTINHLWYVGGAFCPVSIQRLSDSVGSGRDAGPCGYQPGVEVDLFSGEEEALDAVEVADADLGVGFGLDPGAFEGGAAFGEDAAGGVEGFALRKTSFFDVLLYAYERHIVHIFDNGTIEISQ